MKPTLHMTVIEREKKVVGLMTRMYCRNHHHSSGELCDQCSALLDYAMHRLDRCPAGNAKTSCRKCRIHCYAPQQREAIRRVMRYAGPRMIYTHPVMAIRHLIAELK